VVTANEPYVPAVPACAVNVGESPASASDVVRLPEVESGDITDLIILLRAMPGVPFFVQNYLLGLANAPFFRYLVLSCAIQWTLNSAFMLFGDALIKGRGKLVLTAILLLAAISAATHMVRRHMGRKVAKP